MKQQFIEAYTYCYGTTRKEAEKIYKTASQDYIKAIIDSQKQDVHKGFFED